MSRHSSKNVSFEPAIHRKNGFGRTIPIYRCNPSQRQSDPSKPRLSHQRKKFSYFFVGKQQFLVLHSLLDSLIVSSFALWIMTATCAFDSNPSQTFASSNGERFSKRRRIGDNHAGSESMELEQVQQMDTDSTVGAAAYPQTSALMNIAPTTQPTTTQETPQSSRKISYCYYCSCYYCTCRVVSLGSNRVFTSA